MPRAKKLTEEELQAKRITDALNTEAVNEAVVERRLKLPDYIETDPLVRKRVVKRKGLGKYQEQMFLLFMPEMTGLFLKQLRAGVKRGEKDAMQMFAQMCGFIEKKGGINITTNIQQNRLDAGDGGKTSFQFDRIVRQLAEAAKPQHTLPAAPIPPSEQIVDSEALQAGE